MEESEGKKEKGRDNTRKAEEREREREEKRILHIDARATCFSNIRPRRGSETEIDRRGRG